MNTTSKVVTTLAGDPLFHSSIFAILCSGITGKMIYQSDIVTIHWMAKEQNEYRAATGEEALLD